MRRTWGLAGLLGFELILFAYTLAYGALQYAAMALVAAGALAWGLVAARRGDALPRAALALLVLATLARGLAQTVGGGAPWGLYATYLVPLGFALLLVPRVSPAWGIGLLAAGRTWFVAYYFMLGGTTLALANVLGAAGAWLWLAAEARPAEPADEDAPAPLP